MQTERLSLTISTQKLVLHEIKCKSSSQTRYRPTWSERGVDKRANQLNQVYIEKARKLDIPRGILKSQAVLEASHFLCISKVTSKESNRTTLVPDRNKGARHANRFLCKILKVSSWVRSMPSSYCLLSLLQEVQEEMIGS